jgi:hypothetical protein
MTELLESKMNEAEVNGATDNDRTSALNELL